MIGFAQRCVLASLAGEDKDVRTIAYDWPGLTENSARSAINSLARWGFVDAVRFEGRSRLFGLTQRGSQYADVYFGEDDPFEDEV
jgi:glycosyltransferase A (GT-A) superfamily protein (DUF2064 family)